MKKYRIKEYKINGLFGFQNVDISFDSKYKILIGENGLGKTTILNSLYFLLEKKFKKLAEIKFESIELIFTNRRKISFKKSDLLFFIEKPTKYKSGHFYDTISRDLSKENIDYLKRIINDKSLPNQEKRLIIVEVLRKIGIRINAPSQFIYDNIKKLISQSEAISFQGIIDLIDKQISSKILYFPTYRRIESKLSSMKFSQKELFERYPFLDETDLDIIGGDDDSIQFGMDDVKKKIKRITSNIVDKSLIGFSSITGDLLSQLLKDFPQVDYHEIDKKKLRIILDRVGNRISDNDKISITEYIQSGKKNNKGLIFLINKLIDLYNEQEKLDLAIKNFIDTCNGYLNFKQFVYNESTVKIDIFHSNSEIPIKLDQLSSGEKQIVSLFSKIYLDQENDFIIIFDEPEISLSMFWQKDLLPDIIKSNKCNFLLTATHSPFIYDNNLQQYANGLDEYITFIK